MNTKKLYLKIKSLCTSDLLGTYASCVHGSGLAFSDIRKYEVGDDLRRVDWKGAAKTGELHTKLFTEERRAHITFVIPTSKTLLFGSRVRTKLETLLETVGLIAESAYQQGDRVELLTNRGPLDHSVIKRWGIPKLLQKIIDSISDSDDQESLESLLQELKKRNVRNQVLVICSDQKRLSPNEQKLLKTLKQKNQILYVYVFDSAEYRASNIVASQSGWMGSSDDFLVGPGLDEESNVFVELLKLLKRAAPENLRGKARSGRFTP